MKKFCSPMNNITFNSISNMEEIKRSTKLIKSKDELNLDEDVFIQLLNRKRNFECISFI